LARLRRQALRLEASRQLAPGDVVTMDFGPDKLDSQLALDYGVLDVRNARVGAGRN
jgi:hypothetical protein